MRKFAVCKPTFEANCRAAGFGSHIIGNPALIHTSVISFKSHDMKCGSVARTDHLVFPALFQWSFVFVPVHLERSCAIHFTVETGVFPLKGLCGIWGFDKRWRF